MRGNWESISFADLITERKDRFDPDAPEIVGLPKIEKIDFSEGKLHLGEYEPTKTQQIIVEPGDFVFSGLNIEKGAAGFNETADRLVVSANYSTCGFNDSRVSLDFFKHYMRSENFQRLLKANLKKDYGFTRPKHLMPLTFLVPSDKEEQERIVSEYEECKETHSKLSAEITNQQSLLAKLKQAILQEAIQGKLTADWRAAHPDVEPASQLRHRIQAEKARLIAAKKLRPEKPLPQITPAEIPFEIPKGWEWCRLKELGRWCGGGTPTKDVDRFWGDEVPWITPKDMKQPFLSDSQLKLTRIGVEESAAKLIPAKSILFVVRGMILAHTFPVSVNLVETTVNQDMKALMPYLRGLEVFLRLLLESSSQRILSVVTKSTHGTRKLETEVYENFVIPLPPLAEQAAIVERVEALMTTCRLLEAEIAAARTHAAHLLQAVLKEAFAPAAKVAP